MASSPSPLRDFVTRMQDDSELQSQFAADPAGTMTAAGLSPEDQEIVQSRDPDRLNAAIGQQGGDAPMLNWGMGASDPEPDSTGA